jgi:Ca2+-binding RTX toxin-like protein
MKRIASVVVGATVMALLAPGSAMALVVGFDRPGSAVVALSDPAGAADNVTITYLPSSATGTDAAYQVVDPAGITPNKPCEAVSAAEARCATGGFFHADLGAGDDRVTVAGVTTPLYDYLFSPTIYASTGNDRITDAPGPVSSTVGGGPGNDLLLGNENFESFSGGPGADRILMAGGPDDCFGRAGNDVCDGGPGSDLLDGGSGRDRMLGGGGGDKLYGGKGPGDVCAGGARRDTFFFSCERAPAAEVEKRD